MKRLVLIGCTVAAILCFLLPGIASAHSVSESSACTPNFAVLSGPQLQEALLFCTGANSVGAVEDSGTVVYTVAINAAANHIILGTPLGDYASRDWGGNAIQYVEFSNGYHMEYHTSDNIVRVYNQLNQRVY
jgi:hypothetical protein